MSSSCRICLEGEPIKDLIAPCLCSGGSKWVHRNCLDRWRYSKINKEADLRCSECKFFYLLEDLPEEEEWKRKLYIRLYVIRDFILLLMIILVPLNLFTLLAYLIDQKGSCYDFYDPGHSYTKYEFYLLTVVFIILMLTGFIITIILILLIIFGDKGQNNLVYINVGSGPDGLQVMEFWVIVGICFMLLVGGFIISALYEEYLRKLNSKAINRLAKVRDLSLCQSV